jgi:hypothetical protein
MCLPPVIRACGPIKEKLHFEAGLIYEERYLIGTGYSDLVNLRRSDNTRIHQASNEGRPACIKGKRA